MLKLNVYDLIISLSVSYQHHLYPKLSIYNENFYNSCKSSKQKELKLVIICFTSYSLIRAFSGKPFNKKRPKVPLFPRKWDHACNPFLHSSWGCRGGGGWWKILHGPFLWVKSFLSDRTDNIYHLSLLSARC